MSRKESEGHPMVYVSFDQYIKTLRGLVIQWMQENKNGVEGEDHCERCRAERQIHTRLLILQCPDILVVGLNRISPRQTKLSRRIPLGGDITIHDEKERASTYTIAAGIKHIGKYYILLK